MTRIGIFSGTFDPVHRGHIAFALAALKQRNLDRVVLLPERSPRGKLGVSDFMHRLHMLRLAVRPHRKLSVLVLDDVQFTVKHTLAQLEAKYPRAEFVLLLGSDVVRTFGFRWPGLEALLQSVELAISTRAGESEGVLQEFLDELALPYRAHFVNGPHAHLRATDVRKGDMGGIEPLVRDYIQQHQLYRPQVA
jgi:nicotinate-nucleotide adenylyltransferase